jgi:hypothetical protein
MIDHVLVKSTSALFNETVEFYVKALEPIGYKKIVDIPNKTCGFGDTAPDYWVSAAGTGNESGHAALRAKG